MLTVFLPAALGVIAMIVAVSRIFYLPAIPARQIRSDRKRAVAGARSEKRSREHERLEAAITDLGSTGKILERCAHRAQDRSQVLKSG